MFVSRLIMGFVRKKQAEEMLSTYGSGTFLLRFSDSEPGGVTIAWVRQESSEVSMVQPFTSKDFTIRSLADRISDLHELVHLYPDIVKDQAFSKYYTPFSGTTTLSLSQCIGCISSCRSKCIVCAPRPSVLLPLDGRVSRLHCKSMTVICPIILYCPRG